ncbi:MAG TPA: hypothetical protein VG797_04615 [Phycisphaerales bacterium]|nr:hypothetical protein [Phycisphaerales bacterium]
MKRAAFIVAAAGAALLAQSAMAQGTISSGNAFYTRGAWPTTAGGLATTVNQNAADMRMAGAAGTDHAWDFQWWYRFSADTRERTLVSPTSTSWGGSSGNNGFTLSGATGVTAQVAYNISDPDGAGGSLGYNLVATMVVTNSGASAVGMSIFSYFDTFLNGDDAGDTSVLQSADTLRLSQGATTLFFQGVGAQNYMTAAWSATGGAGSVADSAITNYNNTITGSGGSDIASGWQWTNISIGPGQSQTFTAVISTVPTPGAIALAGFAGLAGLRRRR